jgi:hypothetical protein
LGRKETEIFFGVRLDSPNQLELALEIRAIAHGYLGLLELPPVGAIVESCQKRANTLKKPSLAALF